MEIPPHLKLVSLALLLASFSQAMVAPPPSLLEEQAGALLAWKATIHSPPAQLRSWGNTTARPCGWYGIKCGEHRARRKEVAITEISLRGMRLRARLDDLNFTALHTLTSIRLPYNQIRGPFPPTLASSLPNLRHLMLQGNNISGEIPRQIGKLESLVGLSLSNNHLSGPIPTEVGYLKKLIMLDFSSNNLTGPVPIDLESCTKLTILYLDGNQLSGFLPRELGYLVRLQELALSNNKLMGSIPDTFESLIDLIGLYLWDNKLSGHVPRELGSLVSLQDLELSNNTFMGPIPNTFENLTKLTTLHLHHNQLSGHVPRELGSLTSLETLALGGNKLMGPIPNTFENLTKLTNLYLYDNQLSGHVPRELGSLVSLEKLELSGNKLMGPIPNTFENLAKLTTLYLHHNQLSGHVPAMIFLVLIAVILMFSHERRKTKATNTDKVIQAKVFSIWNFDGKNVFKEIVEATNDFSKMHCIGTGGYGSVYKARLATCEIFAVKKIHMIEDDCCVNEHVFIREIEALVQIRHRNVVKLFGYCSSSQGRFLIYEYMERGDLAKMLKDNERVIELNWRRRICIVFDVVLALAYMHHDCSSPIVHRDITSNNILLDQEYRACISDFGTAKVLNIDGENLTRLAGTKGYLALELAYTENVTEKCDVYCFGVLVLDLFMGSHPGDLLSSLSLLTKNNVACLHDLLDPRLMLPDAETAREIYHMLTVAVRCLEPSPSHRPTARSASDELSTINACEDHVDYLHAGIAFPAL